MTEAANYYETDQLCELVRRRYDCLLELRDFGRKQKELIDRGELASLLDLLAIKQRSIERLRQIERALDPFRDQSPQQRRWRSEEHRRRCAELVDRCQSLLAEMIAEEKRCEAALLAQRQHTLELLEKMQTTGNAQAAYRSDWEPSGGQINMLLD